jgi:hypothetical protein
MLIDSAFPSKYLKESDLAGRRVAVTMGDVKVEKIGDDKRPVLYFRGKEKGLVLNKINSNTISQAYGGDTDDWFGNQIVLFPTTTEYAGKTVPCIRVSLPTRQVESRVNGAPVRTQPMAARAAPRRDDADEFGLPPEPVDDFPGDVQERAPAQRHDFNDEVPF